MKITILCSSVIHPIYKRLIDFCDANNAGNQIKLISEPSQLGGGDVLFLVSCSHIVTGQQRAGYNKSFVLHASDLPRGRGWSPHIWQIIEGKEELVISLLAAEDKVDTGAIWGQITVKIPKTSLYDEINKQIFDAEIQLMQRVVDSIDSIQPISQRRDITPTHYRKRRPDDSRLDVFKSISQQFDLMRVSDPERYPAFFELHGKRYKLLLERIEDDTED